MNYSNMIEEKNLKKGFIVATLLSTIVGTLTATMTLHDKVQEKRERGKQKQLDNKQTTDIQQLQSQVRAIEDGNNAKKSSKPSDSSSSSSRSSSRDRRRSKRRDSFHDDFTSSTRRSRAMIEDQYDDYLGRVGSRYAKGDVVTENKLQAQIIALQQNVINVLQDALLNDRGLTKYDISRLIDAQQAARIGTLDALQGQYNRMRLDAPAALQRLPPASAELVDSRLLTISNSSVSNGNGQLRRQSTLPLDPAPAPEPSQPVRRVLSLPAPAPPPAVSSSSRYCRVSIDLQQQLSRPLPSSFSDGGDHRCPACATRIDLDRAAYYRFSLRDPILASPTGNGTTADNSDKETIDGYETLDYGMDVRFVVKCHTPAGEFACLLCSRNRDVDTICGNVYSLVQHLGNHRSAEFERDVDLFRIEGIA